MIIIEEFHVKLKDVTRALILLSKEFERLDTDFSELLCYDYPFDVCLLEVVHDMLKWHETINKHMEVMKLGEETANS